MAEIKRTVSIYIDGHPVTNTLKGIQKELAQLRNVQKNATLGSEEYISATKKIAQLNGIFEEQKETVQQLGEQWDKSKERLSENANILMGVQSAVQMASGAYKKLAEYVEAAATMDDAMADVMKTTGMTHEEVEKLNEGLKDMQTRTSREELNRLASEAGKLGITGVENVQSFVNAADKINVALGEDLGEGAMVTIGKMAQVYAKTTPELAAHADDIGAQMLRIGSAVGPSSRSQSHSHRNGNLTQS